MWRFYIHIEKQVQFCYLKPKIKNNLLIVYALIYISHLYAVCLFYNLYQCIDLRFR